MRCYSLLLIICLTFPNAKAQTDSTKVHSNNEGFGGPKTMEAQLVEGNRQRFDLAASTITKYSRIYLS